MANEYDVKPLSDTISNIQHYYDENGDRWTQLTQHTQNPCDIYQIMQYAPNVQIRTTQDGTIIGYDLPVTSLDPNNNPANPSDSNTQLTGLYATGGGGGSRGGGVGRLRGASTSYIPATATYDSETGVFDGIVSGALREGQRTLNLVSNEVGAVFAAAACLGKFGLSMTRDFFTGNFDNLGVDFNDFVDAYSGLARNSAMSFLDGRWSTRGLWEVDSQGNVSLYLPDNVIAYLFGAFRDSGVIVDPTAGTRQIPPDMGLISEGVIPNTGLFKGMTGLWYREDIYPVSFLIVNDLVEPCVVVYNAVEYRGSYQTRSSSISYADLDNKNYSSTTLNVTATYTRDNKTVYCRVLHRSAGDYVEDVEVGNVSTVTQPSGRYLSVQQLYACAWCALYGEGGAVDYPQGISANEGETQIDPTVVDSDTNDGIIDQLTTNYPDIMGTPIQTITLDDSCNQTTNNYYQVTIPVNVGGSGDIFSITAPVDISGQLNPTLNIDDLVTFAPTFDPDIYGEFSIGDLLNQIYNILNGAQISVGVSLDPNTQEIVQYINNYNTINNTTILPTNPIYPPTGSTGNPDIIISPVIIETDPTTDPEAPDIILPIIPTQTSAPTSVAPSGEIPEDYPTALWTVYNPTRAQVNSLGQWLWSTNFIDAIKKLFQSPIDAIISLHKLKFTPLTSGNANIVCGYLDSGVSSKVVTRQYISETMGTIQVPEYYGNVFDYDPYTEYSLYIPYVGIVRLSAADVVRASVMLTYDVDVFTGAFSAKVKVFRDNAGGAIYEYTGNCAEQCPISQGMTATIFSSGVAAGASFKAVTMASGNPVLGAVAGTVTGALTTRLSVDRSGSFSGNSGQLNIERPYMIISRPQIDMADSFEHFTGIPANQTITIGDASGLVKGKIAHIKSSVAFKEEVNEISAMFVDGVMV